MADQTKEDRAKKARAARRHCIAALLLACTSLAWTAATPAAQPAAPKKAPGRQIILVVGDSLSAEYGLKRGSGWVVLLQDKLKAERVQAEVINASISGDTTSGGRSRLPPLLAQHKPGIVILALGSNDALRGLPLSDSRANLQTMLQASRAAGAKVLLVGNKVPPNYGKRYMEDFDKLYAELARTQQAALVPFLLKGVADDPDPLKWFQADRMHPKEEAQPVLMANVWDGLKGLLKK